ncbi:MAG: Asp-tRNA(Asn)/Glu-tRNA(Gln) amidotransferase subunit GatA [Firmicutes bacterium]|jgi:aspartyl-tRNA(Asn)/glutamyl-tRNA(Gln) amidotransferase subunit A|nr:Asp-tRNA(Asn)/Glu-tRNA(Gln) amidotransferase subunit GatA [Bacillota bacterium]
MSGSADVRPCDMTLHELHDMLLSGQVSSREITSDVLARIDDVEASVGAYVTVDREAALMSADAADDAIARGRSNGGASGVGALAGIPVVLKDNVCTRGMRTTCCSKMLEGFVPAYDAAVTGRLREAGAVIVGKANMDEFAMGSTTQTSVFHVTRNPWDLERVPGGSSGGCAAAVAAGEAVAAIGTDTGGSIRQPASFCGVVGLKPTYGRVSRYGVAGFASSLDTVGPITRDVRDCAIMLNAIAGRDERDSTSAPDAVPDCVEYVDRGVQGLKVGVPEEFFGPGMNDGVRAVVERALRALEGAGADIVEVSLPLVEHALAVYYLVATAEASSNMARLDGIRYGYRPEGRGGMDVADLMSASRGQGFGMEVKRRIMLGTFVLSSGNFDAFFGRALRSRRLLAEDVQRALTECDCLVSPTAPTVAFRFDEEPDDPLAMYLQDIYTTLANLAGVPAMSVPCGFSDEMPVGLQIMGRMFDEATLIRVGRAVELTSGMGAARPKVGGCAK